jgi:hypothetical protein
VTLTAEQWKLCRGLVPHALDLAEEIMQQAAEDEEPLPITPSAALIAAATIITATVRQP